jgi:hypothetical protein
MPLGWEKHVIRIKFCGENLMDDDKFEDKNETTGET